MIAVWALFFQEFLVAQGADVGGGFGFGMNANYGGYGGGMGGNFGGYWCQISGGANVNVGTGGNDGYGINGNANMGGFGFGGQTGFGRRRRAIGAEGNVGYGGYGGGNVQFNGGWQPPKPGCCYYWDPQKPGQVSQKCDEGEKEEQPTEETQSPEEAEEATEAPEDATEAPEEATEAPEEATEAPEEATEVPEEATEAPEEATEAPEEATEAPEDCPTMYCHKVTLKRSTLFYSENEYSDMDSMYGNNMCNDDSACNFTWSQEITEDANLKIRWGFYVNYQAPKAPVDLCEAATKPVGTFPRMAFDLLTRFTTQSTPDGCPIPAGTIDVPVEVDYTFQTDDKIMCGDKSSVKVIVVKPGGQGEKEIEVVNIDLTYSLREDDDDCTPAAQVRAAYVKSLRG